MHSAEHIFWAFRKKFFPDLESESMQFQDDKIRLDFRYKDKIDEQKIKRLEKLVNEQIKKNLPVKKELIKRKQAEKITDLSLIPENVQDIRIVKIGDISTEACVGPHVKNTSEIGTFKILEIKKRGKNKLRIYITVEN